jgi:hypothetical protein
VLSFLIYLFMILMRSICFDAGRSTVQIIMHWADSCFKPTWNVLTRLGDRTRKGGRGQAVLPPLLGRYFSPSRYMRPSRAHTTETFSPTKPRAFYGHALPPNRPRLPHSRHHNPGGRAGRRRGTSTTPVSEHLHPRCTRCFVSVFPALLSFR